VRERKPNKKILSSTAALILVRIPRQIRRQFTRSKLNEGRQFKSSLGHISSTHKQDVSGLLGPAGKHDRRIMPPIASPGGAVGAMIRGRLFRASRTIAE
jgi:hypothetical protein